MQFIALDDIAFCVVVWKQMFYQRKRHQLEAGVVLVWRIIYYLELCHINTNEFMGFECHANYFMGCILNIMQFCEDEPQVCIRLGEWIAVLLYFVAFDNWILMGDWVVDLFTWS